MRVVYWAPGNRRIPNNIETDYYVTGMWDTCPLTTVNSVKKYIIKKFNILNPTNDNIWRMDFLTLDGWVTPDQSSSWPLKNMVCRLVESKDLIPAAAIANNESFHEFEIYL